MVTDFEIGVDKILFIGNEDVPYALGSFSDNGVTGTLITYATDSSILLVDVTVDEVIANEAFTFMFELVAV